MVIKQVQLAPGSNDNKTDCYVCSAYSPNGEGVFHCRHEGEWDVHKCEHCGYCNAFRPITDEDANSWLSDDRDNGTIRRTTFNRWRWVETYEWR
jgi:hypothetical protein